MEKVEKKKRTSNFTEVEKILLVELIDENKHIIENKVTNSSIIQRKEKCWEDITKKFNSASFMYRDTQSLKNCWDNIKKRTRKLFAEERKEMFKTGGGQYHFRDNSLASKTREIIKSSVDGMLNEVDSDCVSSAINKENIPPYENTSLQDAEMNESAVINLSDDPKEYEVEFTKLAESKIALSQVLAKNEMEKHSIEMAISEQKLIREKLEVDVLKTELEIKKTILMREKSRNAMLGMPNETE